MPLRLCQVSESPQCVIPAEGGSISPIAPNLNQGWIPAFAGMTALKLGTAVICHLYTFLLILVMMLQLMILWLFNANCALCFDAVLLIFDPCNRYQYQSHPFGWEARLPSSGRLLSAQKGCRRLAENASRISTASNEN